MILDGFANVEFFYSELELEKCLNYCANKEKLAW